MGADAFGATLREPSRRGLVTIDVMSGLEAAWDELRAANTMSWQVGQPYLHDERNHWEQYAFDPSERPIDGKRSREWVAVGPTEVRCIREMARCLRAFREGRWPK